jgi:hypothetical protein
MGAGIRRHGCSRKITWPGSINEIGFCEKNLKAGCTGNFEQVMWLCSKWRCGSQWLSGDGETIKPVMATWLRAVNNVMGVGTILVLVSFQEIVVNGGVAVFNAVTILYVLALY